MIFPDKSSLFDTLAAPNGEEQIARTTSGRKSNPGQPPAKIDSLLFCLNKAAYYMDNGDFHRAVWALDDVPRDSFLRSKCDPWICETKHALIGREALQSMRARMDCLKQIYRT